MMDFVPVNRQTGFNMDGSHPSQGLFLGKDRGHIKKSQAWNGLSIGFQTMRICYCRPDHLKTAA